MFPCTIASASHVGGRHLNEDAVVVDAAHGLAIVADGAGGVCSGVVAGQLACVGLAHLLRRPVDEASTCAASADEASTRAASVDEASTRAASADATRAWLEAAFAEINALAFAAARDERLPPGELGEAVEAGLDEVARGLLEAARDPKRMSLRGMCAAVVACQLEGDVAVIGHVGDARAYRWRGGRLEALTRDHDLAHAWPAQEPPLPPHLAGVIVRAIGVAATVEPTTCVVALAPGDRLLLCTDGLHGAVADDAIAALLGAPDDAEARCAALIARALAGGGAYPDNVAVAVIDVG